MRSKYFLFGVPLLVGCCAFLWMCWAHVKKRRRPQKREISICDDGWLAVFEFLSPRQIGLGIALISHRFDRFVDKHFKTRKWTLDEMEIWRKIGENGAKEMEICNSREDSLPIPQMPTPKSVVSFKRISVNYIDQNVIAFLRRFSSLFASRGINLAIQIPNDRLLDLVVHNVWPLLKNNTCAMELWSFEFCRLRHFVPSILRGCPSLRILSVSYCSHFARPDGSALLGWLSTPRLDGLPKILRCDFDFDELQWASMIKEYKKAFAVASSPVSFIVFVCFVCADSVLPFDLRNFTGERTTLQRLDDTFHFLLLRCPISRDEAKWAKWEEEAIGWEFGAQRNKIILSVEDDGIYDSVHNATPGPSGQKDVK